MVYIKFIFVLLFTILVCYSIHEVLVEERAKCDAKPEYKFVKPAGRNKGWVCIKE